MLAIALAAAVLGAASGPQEPQCRAAVVSCNYAHHYGGSFSWDIVLQDADSRYQEHVNVVVTRGVAQCAGSSETFERGQPPVRDTISGPGLIGVEFLRDSVDRLVYRVIGACPGKGAPGAGAQPAVLGNSYTQESYQQPATRIGMDLSGMNRGPAPETDAVNGVHGTLTVTWSLLRCTATRTSTCP